MKDVDYCTIYGMSISYCGKRALGCEFDCAVGNSEVSDDMRAEEEKKFGKGIRGSVKRVCGEGFVPLGGENFLGCFIRRQEVISPDYQGGLYSRRN